MTPQEQEVERLRVERLRVMVKFWRTVAIASWLLWAVGIVEALTR